jgi:hypothetical protein
MRLIVKMQPLSDKIAEILKGKGIDAKAEVLAGIRLRR